MSAAARFFSERRREEEEGGTVFFQTGVVPVLAPLPLRRKARTTMMKTTVGN
jgi:hypothetical protein